MKKMKAGAIAVLGLTALLALPACATKTDGETQSESSTTESSEVIADYAITVEAPHAAIVGLPERAKANETVQFKVFAENGYNVTAVTVTTGETTIELTGSYATGFSFTMPEGAVEIKATVVGNISVLTTDETKIEVPNNKDELFESGLLDVMSSFENEGTVYEADKFEKVFIRSGTEVKFTAKHHAATVAENYYVNGEKLVADTYTPEEIEAGANETYTFTMPYSDAKFTADHKIRSTKLRLQESDLITASLYTMDEAGAKTPVGERDINIQDKVYVSAKLNEGVDAIIKSVYIEYDCYSTKTGLATEVKTKCNTNWDSTSKSEFEAFAFVDEDTKYFKLPADCFASDVNVKFEILTPDFAGTEIEGNFAGRNFYGTSNSSTYNLVVDKYGRVLDGYYEFKGGSIVTEEDGSYSVVKGSTRKPIHQGHGSYVLGGLNDFYFYTKCDLTKQEIGGRSYKSGQELICQLYNIATEEILETIYVNISNDTVIFDVTIEMVEGAKFTDSGAKFQVKKDGKMLFMNYVPDVSDSIEGLAFVGKTFRADFQDDDGWGSKNPAWIEITINADNTLLINAENGQGYTIEGETTTFVYSSTFNTIYATLHGDKFKLIFDDTMLSPVGSGTLTGAGYYNGHNIGGQTFKVATTPAA